jgi:hypothetical protein
MLIELAQSLLRRGLQN